MFNKFIVKDLIETFVSLLDSGKSESNRRPIDLQSIALPTELSPGLLLAFFSYLRYFDSLFANIPVINNYIDTQRKIKSINRYCLYVIISIIMRESIIIFISTFQYRFHDAPSSANASLIRTSPTTSRLINLSPFLLRVYLSFRISSYDYIAV